MQRIIDTIEPVPGKSMQAKKAMLISLWGLGMPVLMEHIIIEHGAPPSSQSRAAV